MKKRLFLLLIPALLIPALSAPAFRLYIHSMIDAQTAALFPQSLSLADILIKGADSLPAEHIPALYNIRFEGWMLAAGIALTALGALIPLNRRRGALQLGLLLTASALGLIASFTVQLMNLSNSLLYRLLLDMQAWAYMPPVICAAQLILEMVLLKGEDPLPVSDGTWRRLGGLLALLAAAGMLLPVFSVSVPGSITASAADAAAMNRRLSLTDHMSGREPNLAAIAQEQDVFGDVLSGDLAALEPFSADGNNIRGIFTIRTSKAGPDISLLAALILLCLSGVLAFLPRADRWFPLGLSVAAALAAAAAAPGVMATGEADMFETATRQMARLGLGSLSPAPALVVLLACGAALCGVMSVRRANEPYFVNPIPAGRHLGLVAMSLALLSLVLMLLPAVRFDFVRPGRNRVLSSVSVPGLEALAFRAPEDMLHPRDNKGELIHGAGAAEEGMDAAAVEDSMRSLSRFYGIATWASSLLTLGGLYGLIARKTKKLGISLFLGAFLARVLTWLVLTGGMPKAVGSCAGTLPLYLSLPALVFAAFFTNFAGLRTLPKKYKLFLMILPFLVAVFLFSYLPLYGWSYAFFNYKFGLPMSEQEFVGFKWFTEMFANLGHRENLIRVLKNTFGMSGLNLMTSWMPMVFAIFLNEITKTRFKKAVQIFTTLPNFISWALVFSFAMALFAMDSGIFSKFMLAVGLIDQPVAWLNSPDHIWIKMWAWNTWKGLGWGAIMYLAAISGLDQELYEAAKVDGADRWKQMRYITLPGLLPTFFVLLLLSISNILNNGLEQYMVFQNSMNRNAIEVLDLYVFNITIASKGTALYSFATAIGIFKTLFSVTLLFGANFFSKKLRGESIV